MAISLPSRYEDLDEAYRGRLIPNQGLLSMINRAQKSMQINGGIRFLPIYGESGAGKSSAVREVGTHIPAVRTILLERAEIESQEQLRHRIESENELYPDKILLPIVDQYEENVSGRERIPTQFVEYISLFDRGDLRNIPTIFVWLTTDRRFHQHLVDATKRNRRVLLDDNFSIVGPEKDEWPKIIEETFSFHNDRPLADYDVLHEDLIQIARITKTIGAAIEGVGDQLSKYVDDVQDLSEYQVVLMWPVADGLRNQRVIQFAKPRDGYRLNWDAWFAELNEEDRRQLPLHALNRARLYFDVRIVPLRAADLHRLCLNLENENVAFAKTYIDRFQKTHFYHIVSGHWDSYDFNPVKERESERSKQAEEWYKTVTDTPTRLGRRIASIFRHCGFDSTHERTITSPHSSVRADIFLQRPEADKKKVIIELKAFSSENTMPSTIKDAIKVTLRRHAQFAGFLGRQ